MIALQPLKLGYAHFGCYDDAVARLRAVRAQTLLWYQIAQTGAKDNRTPEEVFRLILAEDNHNAKLQAMEKSVYQREYPLILNTVRGLMTAQ
jgi:hypothetical protein